MKTTTIRENKYTRQRRFYDSMSELGFTFNQAQTLRRIEMTLHRWAERECGTDSGCIERDEKTGKPYWLNSISMRRFAIADRERGALKRLAALMAERNARYRGVNGVTDDILTAYHQSDPRGCALYLVRAIDIPAGGSIDSYYNRGVAVCF